MSEWLRYPHGFWPSIEQELLIKCCISKGDELEVNWRQWKNRVDLDLLETSSHRLLPTLYRNLQDHNTQDPWMDRLRGVYRLAWYKNQLLVDSVVDVLQILQKAGIPTMLIKGISLYARGDLQIGTRHMYDADVLIPPSFVKRAISELVRKDWSQSYEMSPEILTRFRHSIGFSHGPGREVDLHWDVYYHRNCAPPNYFWDTAIPITFNNVNTSVLNISEQFMFTCYHGAAWNYKTIHIDWVTDALLLLMRHRDGIDWNMVRDHAKQYRISYTLWKTFTYLNHAFEANIPEDVISGLRVNGHNRAEIGDFLIKEKEPTFFFSALSSHVHYYWYFTDHLSLAEKIRYLPSYLQSILQVKKLVEIPVVLVSKIIQKITKKSD